MSVIWKGDKGPNNMPGEFIDTRTKEVIATGEYDYDYDGYLVMFEGDGELRVYPNAANALVCIRNWWQHG